MFNNVPIRWNYNKANYDEARMDLEKFKIYIAFSIQCLGLSKFDPKLS